MNWLCREAHRGGWLAGIFALALCTLPSLAATASQPAAPPNDLDRPDPDRWMLLGSFSGSSRSRLLQQASELLFEIEANGELYQDLGAFSLGTSADFDEVSLDWDSSFLRRVYPIHEELPAGAELGPQHVSSYLDVQGLITRGSVRYDYIPDLLSDDGLGAELQGGTAYYLARARRPLALGDRPLDEVLEGRGVDDFHALSPPTPRHADPSLLHLGTDGIAQLAGWLASGIGRGADTERGRIFFDDYPDSVTLFLDLGVPVSADLFLEGDPRLSVGDRIRVVNFIGVSPIAVRLRHFGIETAARTSLRLLRETSIVKQAGNRALVQVQDILTNGIEVIPIKLRPKLRLLGVLRLGYTLLEDRHGIGQASTANGLFGIDLDDPSGFEALRHVLGEGTGRPSLGHLVEFADEHRGVELLDAESRRGSGRIDVQRIHLFSPFRFDNRTVAASEVVTREKLSFRQHTFARSRRLRKTLGRDRNWNEHYVIELRGALGSDAEGYRAAKGSAGEELSIVTGRTDRLASGDQLRCIAETLAELTGDHPVLDEIAAADRDEIQRFFLSIDVHFELDHLRLLLAIDEAMVWHELAALLLGRDHTDAWDTAAKRSAWRSRKFRERLGEELGGELGELPRLTRRPLDLKDRLKLAERSVKRFRRLQRLVETGRCRSCSRRSFRRWEDTALLQLLLFRLASLGKSEPPELRYEIFTDRLARPVVVSNQTTVRPDTAHAAGPPGSSLEPSAVARRTEDAVSLHHFGRIETISQMIVAEDRLRSGELYLDTAGGVAAGDSCFTLRIYSDLRFDPALSLRVELRRAAGLRRDPTLEIHRLEIGPPHELAIPSFGAARFFYDLPLPTTLALEPEVKYSLLLRLLNPDGLPVSEEQQVRFEWPEGGLTSTPPRCGHGAPRATEDGPMAPHQKATQ